MSKAESAQVSFSSATEEELQVMVSRGRMVNELRSGAFFNGHLTPAMNKELEDIRVSLDWRPGMTDATAEKIALDRVWKSGMIQGMKVLSKVMNDMLYEAEKAEKELSKRNEE